MAALIIPPGYAQCVLRWSLTGDPEEMLSTLGVALEGTADTPEEIASTFRVMWASNFPASFMSNAWTFIGVTAYVGQDGGPPVSGESILNVVGTSTQGPLPQNNALLVRKQTGLGGRRNRGRMFLPAAYLGEGDVSASGVCAPALVSGYQGAFDDFVADLTGLGTLGPPVLFHSAAPSTPTVISSLSVQNVIATQRERLRR